MLDEALAAFLAVLDRYSLHDVMARRSQMAALLGLPDDGADVARTMARTARRRRSGRFPFPRPADGAGRRGRGSAGGQSLVEPGEQIPLMLEADGEAQQAIANAGDAAGFLTHIGMGHGGGMGDQNSPPRPAIRRG